MRLRAAQYGIGMGIFEEAGLWIEWKDCHGGTTSMTTSLNKGTLDVAVLSTDGAIADIAQGGSFRILSSFVTSPLRCSFPASPATRIDTPITLTSARCFLGASLSTICSLRPPCFGAFS